MSGGGIGESRLGVGSGCWDPTISNKSTRPHLNQVPFQRLCMKAKMDNLVRCYIVFPTQAKKLKSYRSNMLSGRHHPNPRQPAASLASPFPPSSPTTPIPLHKITHYSSGTTPTSLDRQSSTWRFRRGPPTRCCGATSSTIPRCAPTTPLPCASTSRSRRSRCASGASA